LLLGELFEQHVLTSDGRLHATAAAATILATWRWRHRLAAAMDNAALFPAESGNPAARGRGLLGFGKGGLDR
jgi:hypothetical protein